MAVTLFDLTYRVARTLGTVLEGTASGGSTTTVIDTTNRLEADDYWNKGTVFITYDAGGAGAAPQGEYGTITDFVQSTATITMTALTTAVAASDQYAVAKRRYPLNILKQYVNQALLDLGTIPYTDTTSLDTAAAQTEYTLPSTNANLDLRGVYYQGKTGDANDNQWLPVESWRIKYADIGTANTLVLPQLVATRDIMLVYMRTHPELRLVSDKFSELIHPDRVIYNAALKCLMWYKAKTRSTHVSLNEQINFMSNLAQDAERKYPINLPAKRNKLMTLGNDDLPPYSLIDTDDGWPAIG